ncbi:MAG: hypothetical protein CMH36_10290 [Microbacterium sp.]|uniref:PBP domain-containing protein n=1 Tax=Microbacterium ginsengisoli TaxID=400772 RepID=A0A0F0LVP9_9MICO|nr:hypothetical protein [Microbacterium ginsengisoli]KJL36380.1 hypothetical protein RR49_01712 [Microbacterium ginsengisoli]MAL07199.1 hypothetical protein [Microbacterium sp.]MBN9209083.1 hypothetical protein [Microbacterium ginsengisoli]HAN25714.1 hypothetical protein [Microbacterium ginsengisoli]
MKLKKIAAFGAAFGVAIAGFGAATAAHADPVSDGYSIVGSDTLQDAVAALANGTTITGSSVKVSGAGKALASWDAFTLGVTGGVGSIQTKPFGPVFDRPNGSGAGRNALIASNGGTAFMSGSTQTPAFGYGTGSVNVQNQIDLARSSSVSGTAGTNLTYVPFGQDAIGYMFKVGTASGSGNAAAATSAIQALTKAQLTAIYSANNSSDASAVLSGSGYTLTPVGLQSSSGTWSTFLSKIGVSTLGSAVDTRSNTAPENDGRVLTPGTNEVQIIPLSIANYVGQVNGAARINTMAGATVGSIDGVAPYTGTAPSLVPNTAYYNSSDWGRTVYIVVPTAKISSGNALYDQGLYDLTNLSSSTSLTYWGGSGAPTTSKAVKLKFGFSAPTGTAVTRNG